MQIEVTLNLKGFNTHGAPHTGGSQEAILQHVAMIAIISGKPSDLRIGKDHVSAVMKDNDEFSLADYWSKLQTLATKLNGVILKSSLQDIDAPYGQFAADIDASPKDPDFRKIGLRFIPHK